VLFPVIVPWQFEKKGKQMEVAVDGRLTVNDPELAIRAALDGVGVLYTALGYAASEIKGGRLVPLLEDWRSRSGTIFLYYPSRRQVATPLQAFIYEKLGVHSRTELTTALRHYRKSKPD
jgi:DNA-binding transcriptional LysR family regulator